MIKIPFSTQGAIFALLTDYSSTDSHITFYDLCKKYGSNNVWPTLNTNHHRVINIALTKRLDITGGCPNPYLDE